MFLSPTTYDSARVWTPCVDSLWERCTWELEFIVPRYLEGGEPRGDDDAYPVTVVASGELIEQVTHPHDPHKVVFYYIQTTPATVQHITFAAGPFEMYQVPALDGGETQKPMLAFCLPGQLDELTNSTSFLCRAMSFYTTEFGSFPFSAFKMVFVSNPRVQCFTAVTMAILSSDLLYPANVIDQALETRQVLSMALIQQWVGVNIVQRTLADTWLIVGLSQYLHSLFIRHLLGNNEFRFRLKKDIDRCCRLDQGDQYPLCMPNTIDPPSASTMSFMTLKAPLVLHILDRYIAKAGTSLGLSRVIPRIFLASLSDELPGNMLSTGYFFRLCRKASGMDMQPFIDQWVFGSGCPHFQVRTNFIRKKFTVEMTIVQMQPAMQAAEKMDDKNKNARLATRRPTPFFEGSLTIRIHEADGAPFEHLLDIKTADKTYNLPFNTKYKRTRRSGHVAARFSKLQDVLAQADDNEVEQAEQLKDVDRTEVFAYLPWDDEEEYRRWRVHDWSEEEAQAMLGEGGGYEWIRVDPDCEWLATFDIQEKPWFWISQLEGESDVVAQLQRMCMYPSPVIASELAKVVLVENYFYRVRMEAARALVLYNSAEADYMGLFLLLKLFHTFYCEPTDEEEPSNVKAVPLPNDFSNFANYFLKKSMVTALSDLRDPATRRVWRHVRELLLDLLRMNDNSENEYSDSHYVATVISAIGSAFSAGVNVGGSLSEEEQIVDGQLFKEASEANERAITVDRLVPSYHNVVTLAGLQAQLKSILVGQRTNDPRLFLGYTREGNYEPLRLAAFDCLLLCKPPGRSMALAEYLFDVIRYDYSLTVRRHVARALSESILMTLAAGEVYMSSAPGIIDMNGDSGQRERERDHEDAKIVKAVRKEFNTKTELRELAQKALLDSFTGNDHEILFALIKAAEVMSSGTAEPKPGVLITLPTPTETPAASASTPKIRFSLAGKSGPSSASGTAPAPEGGDFPFPNQPAAPEPPAPAAAPAAPIKLVLNQPPKEKKKKKAAVVKAQAKGLSDSDFKAISFVLQKLLADKRSQFFRMPVDPIRDHAPDYLNIVTTPMDLSTVQAKMDNGLYTSRKDFESDIRLLISNCHMYNPPGSGVRKAGEAFEKFFNSTWNKTENTLKSSANGDVEEGPSTKKASGRPSLSITTKTAMPPPPAPAQSSSSAVPKIKIKSTKSVTLDVPSPSASSPMLPPPVPSSRKSSAASSPAKERAPKKKREKARDPLDDLLGAEVDAIDREKGGDELFDELLGTTPPPPPKKYKISKSTVSISSTPRPRPSRSPSEASDQSDQPLSKKIKLKSSSSSSDLKSKRPSSSSEPSRPVADKGKSTSEKTRPTAEKTRPTAEKTRPTAEKTRPAGDRDKIRSTGDRSKSSARESSVDRMSVDRSSVDRSSVDRTKSTGDKTKSTGERAKSTGDKTKSTGDKLKSTGDRDRTKSSVDKPRSSTAEKSKPGFEKTFEKSSKVSISEKPRSSSDKPRSSSDKPRSSSDRSRPSLDKPPKTSSEKPRSNGSEKPRLSEKPKSTDRSRSPTKASSSLASSSMAGPSTAPAHSSAEVAPVAYPLGYAPKWPTPPPSLPLTTKNKMPFRQKRAKILINALMKEPNAIFFLRPVDPVRDGCPTYLDEIAEPSDFGTIQRHIELKNYSTMGQLARAIELVFSNCRQFNPPGPITDAAAITEAVYWKEWPKAVSQKLLPEERKALVAVINRAFRDQLSALFREPVDPIALGIPQYFDIIPKEDARDLSLIKLKLEKNVYSTARQVDDDFELMLENCRVFNGEGAISDIANQFGAWYKAQRAKMDV